MEAQTCKQQQTFKNSTVFVAQVHITTHSKEVICGCNGKFLFASCLEIYFQSKVDKEDSFLNYEYGIVPKETVTPSPTLSGSLVIEILLLSSLLWCQTLQKSRRVKDG